jgi:DNA primase
MRGKIPDETLQAIRERTSLVDVVSGYVALKRAGRNHVGLCPFHGEKTPSFTVNEERGLFHCFGCGAGGTVFHFIMRIEGLSFVDAVEQLAKRAGVALPERRDDDPAAALREQILGANAEAARFFQEALRSKAATGAGHYLTKRGVRADTAERFGLGFAPPGGAALANWLRGRVSQGVGLQAGLLAQRADGSAYDRFRGRVMFPIRDRRGCVIAFGGRTLGDDQPKYLNSPETPVFHKGENLYGLSEARDAIRSADRVILVEGYLDALAMVQGGFPYTVATLGTALTVQQLRLLRPLGGDELEVFFCFDGDAAGRKAAVRAFGVCAESGVWGRAVFLPEGADPDDFVRSRGAAAVEALLASAPSVLDFYFDQVLPPGAPLPRRMHAAEEVRQILARVTDDVQRGVLVHRAAIRLGVDEDVLRRAQPVRRARPSEATGGRAAPKWPPVERALVEAMAVDAAVARMVSERGTLALFADADLVRAAEHIASAWEGGRPVGEVVEALSEDLARLLTAVLLDSTALGGELERMRLAEDCSHRLEENAARRRRLSLIAELPRAERGEESAWRETLAAANDELKRRGGGVQ